MPAQVSDSLDEEPLEPHLTYLGEQGILVARPSGTVSPSSWRGLIREMLAEGMPRGCARCLLDYRGAVLRFSFAELLAALPRTPSSFELPGEARLAVLLGSVMVHEKEFVEAYMGNRGRRFRVFDDETQAIAWLGEPAPNILG